MNSSTRTTKMAGLLLFLTFFLSHTLFTHAQDGLVALYTFEEGSGTTVRDVSGVGTPLDLTIEDEAAVRWLPDGGLSVDSGVLIASPGPATKILEAAQQTVELTIEAFVKPANLIQGGPARMVSVSATPTLRNFTLGQGGGSQGEQNNTSWAMRLRTTETRSNNSQRLNGLPNFQSPEGTLDTRLIHFVYTRDAAGNEVIYVDGMPVEFGFRGGDFSNWDASYRFGLAAELDNSFARTFPEAKKITACEISRSLRKRTPIDFT